jgi:hypothetical protein
MEQAKSFFEDSRLAGAVPRSFKSFLFQTKYAQLRDFFYDSGASTGIPQAGQDVRQSEGFAGQS